MNALRRLLLAGCLALLLLAVSAAASRAADVYPSCSPAPTDCSAWHRANTTISWRLDSGMSPAPNSCHPLTVMSDGTPTSTCSARVIATGAQVTRDQPVKVDKTPPTLAPPAPARNPDANGWYRVPLAVTFSGSDTTSGIGICTKGATRAWTRRPHPSPAPARTTRGTRPRPRSRCASTRRRR
jgi:hypothetical protein